MFGEGYSFWRGPLDGDGLHGKPRISSASSALKEVNFENARSIVCSEDEPIFRTELKPDKKRSIILGSTVFAGLIKDYDSRKKEHNKILNRLYHWKAVRRIKFTGDVVRDPQGRPNTLFMQINSSGLWQWGCEWAFRPAFFPKSKLPIKKIEIPPKIKANLDMLMGPRRGLVSRGL